jgi:hypothetical protein
MTGRPDRVASDLLDAARAGYGGLLLGAPRGMIGAYAAVPAGPRAVGVTRVLGARHLLQAALTAGVLSARVQPGEVTPSAALLAGSAVDTAHAVSMIGLALARRPLRRAALADAVLEVGFAAFGIMTARHLRR